MGPLAVRCSPPAVLAAFRLPYCEPPSRVRLVKPMSSSVAAVEEWMNECRIHQIFQISVLLKGAHAVIECIGGLTLALVSTNTIAALVNAITGFSWLPALTTI